VPHVLLLNYRSTIPLANFQMAPIFSFLILSGSKKKGPRYECLSEARASHAHKTGAGVSSSVPHCLQMGLFLSPTTYKCHLRVVCPVRRPMTPLDYVLLNDNNHALVAKFGLEINSPACLHMLQGPCWLYTLRCKHFHIRVTLPRSKEH
jgi:hypothetical protein